MEPEAENMEKNCGVCGKKFETITGNKKYCGKECAAKKQEEQMREWAEKKRQETVIRRKKRQLRKSQVLRVKVCKNCGKQFNPPHNNSKYCSTECTIAAGLKQRIDWNKTHGRKLKKSKNYHKTCKICNKEFDTVYPLKKYCTKECSHTALTQYLRTRAKKARDALICVCPTCNTQFVTRDKRQSYCSQRCRQMFKRGPRFDIGTCTVCGRIFRNPIGEDKTVCVNCSGTSQGVYAKRKDKDKKESKKSDVSKWNFCPGCGLKLPTDYFEKKKWQWCPSCKFNFSWAKT